MSSTVIYESLFVAGVPRDVQKRDLFRYFGKFGRIADIQLPWDFHKAQNKGFCFVTFENRRSAIDTLYFLDEKFYEDTSFKLTIRFKEEKKKEPEKKEPESDDYDKGYEKGYQDCIETINKVTSREMKRKRGDYDADKSSDNDRFSRHRREDESD